MKQVLLIEFVFIATALLAAQSQPPRLPYTIVDTGQSQCYDRHQGIVSPEHGRPFYGQDAQYKFHPASYHLSSDGLTVTDNNTGLTWQRSPDTNGDGVLDRRDQLTLQQAEALPARLNATKFGGFTDWRLPTIKELYSLIIFSGVDPSGPPSESARLTPFIDTTYFKFAYGDTSRGERIIDAQYASSTRYVGTSVRGFGKLFGVNFADGRIKGYDLLMPDGGREKTFFVLCVRGNPKYGQNDFHDNGDGTITDRNTGLMWTKTDSAKGMDWQDALAWVQARNAENHLGHSDWRLPHAKELQSIVDYTRSPDSTGSPAIDPLFQSTAIRNEIGQTDFPFYWTSTTHVSTIGGSNAVYIAFGRAAGWPGGMSGRGGPGRDGPTPGGPPPRGLGMDSPTPLEGPDANPGRPQFVDVHGAGAQRSDPKSGDPAQFPRGRGPQGDVIRIYNYVRLVRNAD